LDTGAADARMHGIDTATHQQAGTSIITFHCHVSQTHLHVCCPSILHLTSFQPRDPQGLYGPVSISSLLVDSPQSGTHARAHLTVAATILRLAHGYLPSRTASPSFGCMVGYVLHLPRERKPN